MIHVCSLYIARVTVPQSMRSSFGNEGVDEVTVFAEVEPNQEERILLASKKANNVIAYLGKGHASLIPLAA